MTDLTITITGSGKSQLGGYLIDALAAYGSLLGSTGQEAEDKRTAFARAATAGEDCYLGRFFNSALYMRAAEVQPADPITDAFSKVLRGKAEGHNKPGHWSIHRDEQNRIIYEPMTTQAFVEMHEASQPSSRGSPSTPLDGVARRSDMTIRELQTTLPWTVRYSSDFRANPQSHKDFAHGLLHIVKAAGYLSALVDDMDHDKSVADQPGLGADFQGKIADMVICALRMANTFPGGVIDLQRAVEDRLQSKNNTTLPRA